MRAHAGRLTASRRLRERAAPPAELPTVPGRACDGCDACCVALAIDDPQLQKPQGVRCVHATPGVGCQIYARRPRTCRSFECGWKMLRWVHPALRPDRSGVLMRLLDGAGGEERDLEVVVLLVRRDAVEADGLAETVAAAVVAGRTIHMEAAGKPDQPVGRVQLNEGLAEAVAARDKVEMQRRLRLAYDQAMLGTIQAATR